MNPNKESGFYAFLKKNTALLVMLLLGVLLMLLPGRKESGESESLFTEEEARLSETLARMDGVGEAYVLLAENDGRYGGFTGAVIVCHGAANPAVRLRVINAVSAFTGLGSDKILVQKLKQ